MSKLKLVIPSNHIPDELAARRVLLETYVLQMVDTVYKSYESLPKPDIYFHSVFERYEIDSCGGSDVRLEFREGNDDTGINLRMHFDPETRELVKDDSPTITIATELLDNICMLSEDKIIFHQFLVAIMTVLQTKFEAYRFSVDFMRDNLDNYDSLVCNTLISNIKFDRMIRDRNVILNELLLRYEIEELFNLHLNLNNNFVHHAKMLLYITLCRDYEPAAKSTENSLGEEYIESGKGGTK